MNKECYYCHRMDFATITELAVHIQKEHPEKHSKFAASVTHINPLSYGAKHDAPKKAGKDPDFVHTPLYYTNIEYAESRQLSGDNVFAATHCPKCNKGSRQLLPKEFVEYPYAWRNKVGAVMTQCQGCRVR